MSTRHVVITGSTRGIGLGLAEQFLKLGCRVTINGRSTGGVETALAGLRENYGSQNVSGCAGNVAVMDDVRRVWREAVAVHGPVDIWINNAGLGQRWAPVRELEETEIRDIIDVNINGTINGCRAAIEGMTVQGGGQIYNLEGYGSDGRTGQLLTVYGMSKRAVQYLSKGLAKELSGSPILLGTLSPGMVITDLLLAPMARLPVEFEKAKKIFNIIADRVETVTPFLAKKVLANKRHGVRISWISAAGITLRFMFAPFRKRNVFEPH